MSAQVRNSASVSPVPEQAAHGAPLPASPVRLQTGQYLRGCFSEPIRPRRRAVIVIGIASRLRPPRIVSPILFNRRSLAAVEPLPMRAPNSTSSLSTLSPPTPGTSSPSPPAPANSPSASSLTGAPANAPPATSNVTARPNTCSDVVLTADRWRLMDRFAFDHTLPVIYFGRFALA